MKRKRIAALMAGVDREYQHALTKGMARAAKAADADLCIFNCQGQPDGFVRDDRGERAIFDLPDLGTFDGAVVLLATIPTKVCRDQIRAILAQHADLPLVTIDVQYGNSVQLEFDDVVSINELMEHLLDVHGVRRFALVTGPVESRVTRARTGACRQMLASRGIELPEDAVYDGRWVREGGRKAAEQFLSRLAQAPEAIVCENDDMAFGVIEALQAAGLRVPEDVIVTGFDARQEAVGRGLTTIRRPVRKAGELAVNTLLRWMAEGRPQENEITLATQLVYGDSCGCKPEYARSRACVQLLSDERRLMEKCLRQMTDFVTALANVSTLREVNDELTAFTRMWDAREMHVCVNPEFMNGETQRFPGSYPEEMLLLSGWSMGTERPQKRFATHRLLPRLDEERDAPVALVFSPLSYMGSNLGYMAYDVEHVVSAVLPSLLLLMASSLTSLSLRAAMQGYANVLERISVHDALTGLHNRRGMQQLIPPVFERAKQEGKPFAVVCCDMDDLKSVNDRFGHLSGDQAIRRLSRAISVLEQEGLTCIHISGDEFLALGIPTRLLTPEALISRVRESVEAMNRSDVWLCDICVSAGAFVGIPKGDERVMDFVLCADNNMYEEKHLHHRRIGRKSTAATYEDN